MRGRHSFIHSQTFQEHKHVKKRHASYSDDSERFIKMHFQFSFQQDSRMLPVYTVVTTSNNSNNNRMLEKKKTRSIEKKTHTETTQWKNINFSYEYSIEYATGNSFRSLSLSHSFPFSSFPLCADTASKQHFHRQDIKNGVHYMALESIRYSYATPQLSRVDCVAGTHNKQHQQNCRMMIIYTQQNRKMCE